MRAQFATEPFFYHLYLISAEVYMHIVRSGSPTSCQVDDFENNIEKFFKLLKEGIHFIESKQSSGPRFKVDDFFTRS